MKREEGSRREPVPFRTRLRRPGWLLLGAALVGIAIGTMPEWGSNLLSRLDFFRLRHVEVRGTRYLSAEDVMHALAADTTMSIWVELDPFRDRVLALPLVRDTRVRRRLPATLVVTVEEKPPVALVSTREGMQPFDSAGTALPIDPARTPMDLPVLYAAERRLLGALGRIAAEDRELFARINAVRMDGTDAMILELDTIRVRALLGVSASRLADIFPVESDLARRGAHAAELDLRYRDQVIARLK